MSRNKFVSFSPSSSSSLPISGSSTSARGIQMDPDLARRLSETGATLILLDFPVGAEFGIDMNVWNTGEKFKGVKMIPPGKHFVYWSAVSKEGSSAPRTGFFHDFTRGEVLAKKYSPESEEVVDLDLETARRLASGDPARTMDTNLGPYPYDTWKRWVSLTNKISDATLSRLEPMNGKIQSVTELIPEKHFTSRRSAAQETPMEEGEEEKDVGEAVATAAETSSTSNKRTSREDSEEARLPKMRHRPGTEIRYTPIPSERYPAGSTPAQITRHSMDSTFQLEQYLAKFQKMYGDQVSSSMAHLNQSDEVLGELQFSFICFLVGHHYDSFEHWKRLLTMLCTCEEALVRHSDLYVTLINDMHFQIREVPDDFFVDIVSNSNFLVTVLTRLFQSAKAPSVDETLRSRAEAFRANLTRKFDWDFEQDLEEEQPVVVDLGDVEGGGGGGGGGDI